MSIHSTFKLESRPYGTDGDYATHAKITCGWCGQAEWHVARDSGIAIRVFRGKGWKVGNKPNQHRCAACFAKAKHGGGVLADNPVIPASVGKQIKERIIKAHTKDMLLTSSAFERRIDTPLDPRLKPTPTPKGLPTAPAKETVIDTATSTPRTDVQASRLARTPEARSGTAVFNRRANAVRSGANFTNSTDGAGFYVFPVPGKPGLWFWKLAEATTPEERATWRPAHLTPRVFKSTTKKPKPVPVAAPTEEPMIEPQPTKDPMPPTSTIDLRPPTRDERATIHDELTKLYSLVDQRYVGGESDKTVAERLKLPRLYVTELREMFFGDYDRNAETEGRIKGLDAAIGLAKDATKRLLEMASEAESLEQSLMAARKKLGV